MLIVVKVNHRQNYGLDSKLAYELRNWNGSSSSSNPHRIFVKRAVAATLAAALPMAALAADEIVMGETAILGPVDPQIAGVAASDLRHLMENKNPDRIGDMFHLLASTGGKCEQETIALVRSLVASEQAVHALTSGVTTHGNGITYARAKALGLPVRTGVPREYFEIIDRRLNRPQLLWDL